MLLYLPLQEAPLREKHLICANRVQESNVRVALLHGLQHQSVLTNEYCPAFGHIRVRKSFYNSKSMLSSLQNFCKVRFINSRVFVISFSHFCRNISTPPKSLISFAT